MSGKFTDTSDVEPVCSLCGRKLYVIGADNHPRVNLEQEMIHDGGVDWFTLGYGSDFDTENWLLCFCDDCLRKLKPLRVWNYMYHQEQKQLEKAWAEAKTRLEEKSQQNQQNGIRKIAINIRSGGYSLSHEAVLEYAKRKQLNLIFERDEEVTFEPHYSYWLDVKDCEHEWYPRWEIWRDDTTLIQVIEELGEEANGPSCELKIVEIPADITWEIHECDSGREWIAESHRTWY